MRRIRPIPRARPRRIILFAPGTNLWLPTLVTNCSNNYGPYHFPEKLIPLMIINGLEGNRSDLWRRIEHPRLALCR